MEKTARRTRTIRMCSFDARSQSKGQALNAIEQLLKRPYGILEHIKQIWYYRRMLTVSCEEQINWSIFCCEGQQERSRNGFRRRS